MEATPRRCQRGAAAGRDCGAFDLALTDLVPTYELWVPRPEKWFLVVTATEQFAGNRTAVA